MGTSNIVQSGRCSNPLCILPLKKNGIIQMFSTGGEQPYSCKEMCNYTQFVRQ
jgi:hypothetical protein